MALNNPHCDPLKNTGQRILPFECPWIPESLKELNSLGGKEMNLRNTKQLLQQ
jgi:hypothetical protein